MKQNEKMMSYYQKDIDKFDKVALYEDFRHNINEYLKSLVQWDEKTVIEVGVGTGRILSSYIDVIKKAYLIDISDAMLNHTMKKYSSYLSKLHFFNCNHFDLQTLELQEKADIFISAYTLGHAFLDSNKNPEETFADIIKNSLYHLKNNGSLIIIENEKIYGEQLSFDRPLKIFFDYLNSFGFQHVSIDTTYKFDSVKTAYDTMNSFFGEEVGNKIKKNQDTIIQATAGIWYKKMIAN